MSRFLILQGHLGFLFLTSEGQTSCLFHWWLCAGVTGHSKQAQRVSWIVFFRFYFSVCSCLHYVPVLRFPLLKICPSLLLCELLHSLLVLESGWISSPVSSWDTFWLWATMRSGGTKEAAALSAADKCAVESRAAIGTEPLGLTCHNGGTGFCLV